MITSQVYDKLEKNYGKYASWAIWDSNDIAILPTKNNMNKMRTDVAFLALNASRQTNNIWEAFHLNKRNSRDKIFRDIVNSAKANGKNAEGAYITDMFKGEINANSGKVKAYFNNLANINQFKNSCNDLFKELDNLPELKYIYLFGGSVDFFIKKYLKIIGAQIQEVSKIEFEATVNGKKHTFIKLYHYSYNRLNSKKTPWITNINDLIDLNVSRIK